MKRRWHSSLLRRFALSFSVLLLLLAGFGAFASYRMADTVAANANKTSLMLLSQFMAGVEYRLREVDSITSRLIAMPQIVRLRASEGGAELPFLKYEALESMKPYALYNNLGTEYVLYFSKSGTIVTTKAAYDVHEFYALNGYDGMDFSAFSDLMLTRRTSGAVLPVMTVKGIEVQLSGTLRFTYPVLTYVKSMPVSPAESLAGAALAQINVAGLQSLIPPGSANVLDTVYAMDKAGRVVFRLPLENALFEAPSSITFDGVSGVQTVRTGGEQINVNHVVSPYNGWTYVAMTPYAIAQAEVVTARRLMAGVTAVSFAAGLFILLGVSWLNAKPILEMRNVLRLFIGGGDAAAGDLESLRSGITAVTGELAGARSERDKARTAREESIIRRLLYGAFDEQEVLREADDIGVDLRRAYHALALIRSTGAEAVTTLIRYAMPAKHDGTAAHLAACLDEKTGCLLLGFDVGTQSACRAEAEKVLTGLRGILREHGAVFAAGQPFTGLRQAAKAYDEAAVALSSLSPQHELLVHWCDVESRDAKLPYFPLVQEQRLIAAAAGGNLETADEVITLLHRRNTEPALVSGNDFHLLRHEIIAAAYKMGGVDAAKMESDMDRAAHLTASRREEVDSIFRLLREAVAGLCAEVNDHKRDRSRETRDRMLGYVDGCFRDPGLCLNSLADALGVSETYASQLFAELTGENFSHYVERLRLEEAKRLLKQTGRTVVSVADEVGYTSAASFRRAFKRATGVNPAEFSASS